VKIWPGWDGAERAGAGVAKAFQARQRLDRFCANH